MLSINKTECNTQFYNRKIEYYLYKKRLYVIEEYV